MGLFKPKSARYAKRGQKPQHPQQISAPALRSTSLGDDEKIFDVYARLKPPVLKVKGRIIDHKEKKDGPLEPSRSPQTDYTSNREDELHLTRKQPQSTSEVAEWNDLPAPENQPDLDAPAPTAEHESSRSSANLDITLQQSAESDATSSNSQPTNCGKSIANKSHRQRQSFARGHATNTSLSREPTVSDTGSEGDSTRAEAELTVHSETGVEADTEAYLRSKAASASFPIQTAAPSGVEPAPTSDPGCLPDAPDTANLPSQASEIDPSAKRVNAGQPSCEQLSDELTDASTQHEHLPVSALNASALGSNSGEVSDVSNSNDVKDVKDVKDVEDVEDVEDREDVEDMEDVEDVEDVEKARDSEAMKDSKDLEALRDSKDEEVLAPLEPELGQKLAQELVIEDELSLIDQLYAALLAPYEETASKRFLGEADRFHIGSPLVDDERPLDEISQRIRERVERAALEKRKPSTRDMLAPKVVHLRQTPSPDRRAQAL